VDTVHVLRAEDGELDAMSLAMLLDSSVFKLVEQFGYPDALGVDDHEDVNVILLRAVCYFPSCPPLAPNALTLSHLHQSMKHRHVGLVHVPARQMADVVSQGFKAQVVESGFLGGLEEPKDSLYGFAVGSLSVTVPSHVVITIDNIVWILNCCYRHCFIPCYVHSLFNQ
jgi:hypothetical protein